MTRILDGRLRDALSGIDANALVKEFLSDDGAVTTVAEGCHRISLWANSLSEADPNNPAAPFLFEMQRASHDVTALLALSLYVPAAAAMRAMCETALYYSYFRTHPAELGSLVTRPDFFISKAEILAFHKQHSRYYRKGAQGLGIPGTLDIWYSKVSAIIHGQLPGAWGKRLALADTKHVAPLLKDAVSTFSEGVGKCPSSFAHSVMGRSEEG